MISLVSGTIGILVGFIIILLIRKDRLHIQHGLGWIMVAVGFALLGFSPSVIDYIGRHLGIAYPPTLALVLGMAMLVIKVLMIDIERTRIEVRNQRLNQRLAMLETELKTLKDAVMKSNSPVD